MKTLSANQKPATTFRVFSIPTVLRDLLEAMVDEEGVLSAEGLKQLDELLHSAQESILDLSCYVIECEAEIAAIREIANASLERARLLSLRVDKYKEYLLNALDVTGYHQLRDSRVRVSIKNNPASVWITDEKAIPPNVEYWRVHREPNRSQLKEQLKSGKEIPGVQLMTTRRLSIQ